MLPTQYAERNDEWGGNIRTFPGLLFQLPEQLNDFQIHSGILKSVRRVFCVALVARLWQRHIN